MRKTAGAVVFAALLAGGVQFYLGAALVPAYISFAGAAFALGYVAFGR